MDGAAETGGGVGEEDVWYLQEAEARIKADSLRGEVFKMNAEEITNKVGRLREKLQRLRTLDSSLQTFGAISHKYRLGVPLAEAKLRYYEEQFGVVLPSGYRRFLMEVGHGGAGPFYGLFPLDSRDPEFINMFGGDLGKPFPWASSFNPDEWERDHSIASLEGVEWDENGKYVGMFLPGALYLCHCGCAIRNFLIVCGPCEGEVWRDSQATGEGIVPEVDEHGNRLGFLDWYEQWLDKSLQSVTAGANGSDLSND